MNEKIMDDRELTIITYYSLALSHFKSKEYEKAIEALDEVIRLHPCSDVIYNKGMAHRGLGEKYSAAGDSTRALKEIDKALYCFLDVINLEPNDAKANYNAGCCLLGLNYSDSIHYFKTAIEIDPDYTESYHMTALALFIDKREKDALTWLKRYIQRPNPCIKDTNRKLWLTGLDNLKSNYIRREIRHIISELTVIPDFLDEIRKTPDEMNDLIDKAIEKL